MTPKEKAIELVYRYYLPHPFQKLSKQFALTNVNELIKECTVYRPSPESRFDYWQEVKKEIEKL